MTKSDLDLVNSSENPNVVYFSKEKSLNCTIIGEILQKRLDIKAQMKGAKGEVRDQLEARQNAIKIFVNAIYGLSGA